MTFSEGYTWPGLGMPLVLCRDCTEDIEASVESYGEPPERSKARLMDRLRGIGVYSSMGCFTPPPFLRLVSATG
jgi:hypothetical protein